MTTSDALKRRFFEKVEKTDSCWFWTACKCPNGYGRFSFYEAGKTRSLVASRVSWEIHHGAIPVGLFVLHRCDNPSCVRPGHLFLGTQSENCADRDRKGRTKTGTAHGVDSHFAKLTEEQVREIRRIGRRTKQAEVAGRFGISVHSVSNIVNRKSWAHVHD